MLSENPANVLPLEGEIDLQKVGVSAGAILRVAFGIEQPHGEAFGSDPEFGGGSRGRPRDEEQSQDNQR